MIGKARFKTGPFLLVQEVVVLRGFRRSRLKAMGKAKTGRIGEPNTHKRHHIMQARA